MLERNVAGTSPAREIIDVHVSYRRGVSTQRAGRTL